MFVASAASLSVWAAPPPPAWVVVVVELAAVLLPPPPPPPQATSASAATAPSASDASLIIGDPLSSWFAASLYARGSMAGERRLAPLHERRDALAKVLGHHAVRDPVTLELQVVGERVVEARGDQALRHADVVGRLRGQLRSLLTGAIHQLLCRHDLGDDAQLARLLGAQDGIVQQQLHRS